MLGDAPARVPDVAVRPSATAENLPDASFAGQQETFLIALKLAQYAVVAEACGERPILLLDDLFDKLDAGRVEQLIRLVSEERFGQILISDCNPTRLRTILDRAGADYTLFEVEHGTIKQ